MQLIQPFYQMCCLHLSRFMCAKLVASHELDLDMDSHHSYPIQLQTYLDSCITKEQTMVRLNGYSCE